MGGGGGNYESAVGVGNTSQLATLDLQGTFSHLFGSYFGDWDTGNNLLRGTLAAGLLGTVWGGNEMMFQDMALDEPIGAAIRRCQNASYGTGGRQGRLVHVALMGDPTLRPFPIPPITELQADSVTEGIRLEWAPLAEADRGYMVYRRAVGAPGYERLTMVPVHNTIFYDTAPMLLEAEYMVRPLDLDTSASGTFERAGAGVSVTNDQFVGVSEMSTKDLFQVHPVPNEGRFTLTTTFPVRAGDISLMDLNGREVPVTMAPLGNGWSLATDVGRGCFALRIRSDRGVHTLRVIISR
jgi:hypothetical protein